MTRMHVVAAAVLIAAALALGACVTKLAFGPGRDAAVDAALAEDAAGFLAGTYRLLGSDPAGRAYAGTLRLTATDGGALAALRCVAGARAAGRARLAAATADSAPVLDVSYDGGDGPAQARFLIDGDLDNFALLSGPVRWADGGRGWEHAHVAPNAADTCG